MTFEWKPGSRFKVDANTAGAVCEQLEAAGNLSAKSLLDVSRPKDAPLHSEFEWNDSIAAEKFREGQARNIINHLVVRLDEKPDTPVRGFFQITQQEPRYTNVNAILTHRDLRAELIQQALEEMAAFQRKYGTLTELATEAAKAAPDMAKQGNVLLLRLLTRDRVIAVSVPVSPQKQGDSIKASQGVNPPDADSSSEVAHA